MMKAETMDGGEGDREGDEKEEEGDRPMEAMCAASEFLFLRKTSSA